MLFDPNKPPDVGAALFDPNKPVPADPVAGLAAGLPNKPPVGLLFALLALALPKSPPEGVLLLAVALLAPERLLLLVFKAPSVGAAGAAPKRPPEDCPVVFVVVLLFRLNPDEGAPKPPVAGLLAPKREFPEALDPNICPVCVATPSSCL